MASKRRIVITGLGVLCPLAMDVKTFWDGFLSGRSGIRTIHGTDTSALKVHIGGEVIGFDAKKLVNREDRKQLKVMARTIQLGVCAAQLALSDAALDKSKIDPTRFGVEFGCGLIASELDELAPACKVSANCRPGSVNMEAWGEKGLPAIPPLWMLKYLPNMAACHVSILHNAQGPNNTITESDVASLLALGEAYRILERDQADFFLVGGAESRMNPLSLVRQAIFQTLSHRNDAPEKASRPFDRQRDGMVISEGGAVLAVEELEHAKKRSARIYAEIVGFGAAFDRLRDGKGIVRAIRAALDQAGIGPEEIDHVNAHGFSTPTADVWESRGLQEVFGNRARPVPVFAPKANLGNMGAAAGTTEMAAGVLALQNGVVPPTLNYEEPDPECPISVVAGAPRPMERSYLLKIGFTDMGQVGAVVCRQWK